MRRVGPGVLLAVAVAVASIAISGVETRLFGSPVIEALVVALIVGMLVRLVWRPSPRLEPGIRFAGKQVLELSVAILGISVDLPLLLRAGPALGVAIVSIVAVGLVAGMLIARGLGLRRRSRFS